MIKKLLFLLVIFSLSPLFAASSVIVELNMHGAIGPASSTYLKQGIEKAVEKKAQLIIIKLNTPGGLLTSTRKMVEEITNSKIPIVMYVSPAGAHAASAGTYLMYAATIAAMAPGTNIGAATPINMLFNSEKSTSSVAKKKILNDAVAYIQSLAELHDRNASWAVDAVKNARSISATKALQLGVINLVANDRSDLLFQLDEKLIKINHKVVSLKTKDAVIYRYNPDWKTKFLYAITDPNITYILLLIAIYGIFFELLHPGGILPGAFGVIAGITALYAMNLIPFNYAGLLLIVLGISFMIAEVFVAGFGVLGFMGVVSFIFGSLFLFNAQALGGGVSLSLIIALSLVSLAFFVMVARLFMRLRNAKVVTGEEEMIGSIGEVVHKSAQGYHVLCHGEMWSAVSTVELEVGKRVEVVGLEGLTLHVKPIKE